MYSALTIAGSDCSGGAGIQADLKTFGANGVYGQSAIVALVDENTQGVYDIMKVSPEFVQRQIRSCLEDIGADAIKIGMLDNSDVVLSVKKILMSFETKSRSIGNIVIDPVMVSTSGHKLLEDSAIEVLKSELIPMARVITPNLPEAELLLARSISESEFDQAARDLSCLGGGKKISVLLKAGHLQGTDDLVDYFYDAENDDMLKLSHKRIETKNTHGTGCSLSAAFAANLAKGMTLADSARSAKAYISCAISAGSKLNIGKGHGPVHHFYKWW